MSKFVFGLAIPLLLATLSCSKDESERDYCQELRDGIVNSNLEKVNYAITKIINDMPSQDYTEENINKLVNLIEDVCKGSASLQCFDCIKTLPSQTEVKIGYSGSSGLVNKTVDITYTSNNEMRFSNLHD